MPTSATLREVADLAGVSIGTASHAINNRPNVSPETRARVLEAAVTLGYHVREVNAGVGESAISVIGMLTMHDQGTEVGPNIFYSHVQSGVESECRKRGLSLMYSQVEVDQKKRPLDWPAMIRDGRIEGLLLIGTFIEGAIDLLQKKIDVPIVLVDSYAPQMPFDRVLTDNEQGAITGVQYLIDQGHRHIGLIGWNENALSSIYERRDGYLEALRRGGITDVIIEESTLSRGAGYEAVQRLMRRAPHVTAVFVCNDDTAIGVMSGARAMGLHLPEELSVVGFDNVDLSRAVTPALTTVHVHKTWMGMIGVRQLLARAQNPEQPYMTTRITTKLTVRDSVCPNRRR